MLSVIDLIEAGTLSIPLAAWLVERVESGSSWLVGANPGGAGKTAVMGALLTMLPDGEPVHVTNRGGSWRSAGSGECLVAYEISPAHYEAYIWGDDCRRMAELGLNGTRIVANLHADTLEEARQQLVQDNGLSKTLADAFEIFVPIRVERGLRGVRRFVEQVQLMGGGRNGSDERIGDRLELDSRGREIGDFLESCSREGIRRIEELRKRWLAFRRRKV